MDHQVVDQTISPESLLRQAKLRRTPVRVALLHTLRRAKEPLNAAQINERLDAQVMNRVTVYRTLETLVDAEVVTRLDLGRGHALYEISAGHHHHHFSCQECRKITAVDVAGEKNLLQAIAKKYRIHIARHAIELSGLCPDCKRK